MENVAVIEEKKSSHGIILLSIIVIAVIGFVYVQYKKTTTWLAGVTKEQVQEEQNILLGKSTFSVGENTPMKVADEDVLPSDIALFVGANPTNLLVKQATGDNGKPVYRITFAANDSLATFHLGTVSRVRSSRKWTITHSERASAFSVIDAENGVYRARVSATYISDVAMSVLIEIQSQ